MRTQSNKSPENKNKAKIVLGFIDTIITIVWLITFLAFSEFSDSESTPLYISLIYIVLLGITVIIYFIWKAKKCPTLFAKDIKPFINLFIIFALICCGSFVLGSIKSCSKHYVEKQKEECLKKDCYKGYCPYWDRRNNDCYMYTKDQADSIDVKIELDSILNTNTKKN